MLYLAPQLLSFAPSTGGALAARRRLAPLAMYEQPAAVGELTSILEVQADGEAAAAAAALREILGEAEEPLFEEEEGETISAGGDPENLTIPQLKELLKAKGLQIDDIDLWELNEAFASQCLYCRDTLGIEGLRA